MADEPTTETVESKDSEPKPKSKAKADAEVRFTQADFDKFAAEVKRKEREAAQVQIDAEVKAKREQVERELHEAELLKQEKFKELADAKTREADELRAELKRRDREAKVVQLLDKHEIQDPVLRETLLRYQPQDEDKALDELDGLAVRLKDAVKDLADADVAKRLNLKPPARPADETAPAKKIADMAIEERIELREKLGDQAYAQRVAREHKESKGSAAR